jgi:hypothetical protein
MYPGVKIQIGGEEFILPPLGLEGFKQTVEVRAAYDKMSTVERLDATVEMVWWALTRNYPDYTLDQMRKDISAGELIALQEAFPVLLEKSGPKRRGEAKKGSRARK